MSRTILDIVVETDAGGTVHHMTVADFPKRGCIATTSRERALQIAKGEIEFILLDLDKGKIVRLFDTFDMSVTEFTKT